MGMLVNGRWQKRDIQPNSKNGEFIRKAAGFRHWITADGSSGYKAEAGRYHLYVSKACPWAHRVTIFRKLKGLESMISISYVEAFMGDEGWTFATAGADYTDPLYGASHLHQIYSKASSDYTGRVTVPVLWDKKTQTIVSNESSEIIRMFNSAFDGIGATPEDYAPTYLKSEIDVLNCFVYEGLNNGVYRAGFAKTQAAYQEAVDEVFDTLDKLENILAANRYLTGGQITEADWRLFTTLIRFDHVYVGHFKCNKSRLRDYPNLSGYVRDLYQQPGISETVDFNHIKTHYYTSHESINPTRVVPKGPLLDFNQPHKREILTLKLA